MVQNFFENFYNKYYLKIYSNYNSELEKIIGDSESLLDVGCGNSSPIQTFSQKLYCVGVDTYTPSIEESKKKKIHEKYYKIDVLDIGKQFKPNSFDCVLASDVIEHLEKDDGLKLLIMMEKIAKEKVIILTPNGFLPQGRFDDNPFQVHRSGWDVREMRNRGYKVIGINGWKSLRGACGIPKFKPRYFWVVVSGITQLFVKHNPEKAFQILCIKTKK